MIRLKHLLNIIVAKRAGLAECVGTVLFLSGCYLVWYPLPLLVGGAGLLGLGFMLDYLERQ